MIRRAQTRSGVVVLYWVAAFVFLSSPVSAEVYVSGQAGLSFPSDLRNVEETGSSQGVTCGSLGLKTPVSMVEKSDTFLMMRGVGGLGQR